MKKNKIFVIIFSIIILIFSFVISLCLGAEKIDFSLLLKDFFINSQNPELNFQKIILFKLRLPRSLLALLTGILLAGSGAIFQMFFRNPLAEPGIMGLSSGATLGAVFAQVLGISLPFTFISPVNIFAFIGAIFSGLIITTICMTKMSTKNNVMILLCGTALGTLYSSLSSAILLTSNKELHSIYTWILGSFNGRGWNELLFILIPSILSIVIMIFIAPVLDLLSCGETTALTLGVEVKKLKILVIIAAAFAVSASVCAGGTISFVGLIAPHIARKIIGPKAKNLVVYSMILGGILLLLADTLARTIIAPSELPTGIITSILGVPFFLSLIAKKEN